MKRTFALGVAFATQWVPCIASAAPDETFAVEDDAGDEDLDDVETIETVSPEEAPAAGAAPTVAPVEEDDGAFTFEVQDLTEDEAALAEELAVEKVEVKGAKGTVKGTLKDAVSGEPLIGAYVEAIGTKYKTKTGAAGDYEIDLPPGTYELRLRSDTSQPLRVSNIEISNGSSTTLNRDLMPLEGTLETVEVTAEMNKESEGARLLQRKESSSARDLMSRDEISKSGGGSTSAVARRIVGSTVVGGRFLFVRGLGHRYGNTLLDGARVPSPEPELRTVPLDIFPSGALSAINVQKTFTPDVPADFTGGSTQLETRDVPDEFFLDVGAEIGANSATTFRRMVTSGGFLGADAFGFGNRPRALDDSLPDDVQVQRNSFDANGQRLFTDEQIEAFGESMNRDTRVRRGAVAPPNFGAKATMGHGTAYGGDGGRIGFVLSADFKNAHQTKRELIRSFGLSDGGTGELNTATPQVDYRGFKTTYRAAWSALGLLKWRANKRNRFALATMYSRDSEDETRRLEGVARPVNGEAPLINTRQRYIMRSVLFSRLGGRHDFPKAKDLRLDWFGSYSQARRDDPSMRDMLYSTNNEGRTALDTTNGGGKLLFLDLLDHTENGAANLTLPFKQWKQLESRVKTGAWVEGKQREFLVRRFAWQPVNGATVPTGTGDILTDEEVGGGSPSDSASYFINETSRAQDSYRARQEIYAAYAMIDLPFVRWFRTSAGARFEASDIRVLPFDPFDPDADLDDVTLQDRDVLPSVSLIFSPRDDMNVRVVGTRTLARPEFRELAEFEFADFVGAFNVRGNPNLVSTKVWNADLRWEWFVSAKEVIAVSAFYKRFDDPIERIAQPRANGLQSFVNAQSAQNIGGELEVRKNLEFLAKALESFSLGANFAYIYSRVQLADQCDPINDPTCDPDRRDISTSRQRPLQGQSPYVLNAYLDYDNERLGTQARVLYNTFGRRIDLVAGFGAPDIYEEPQHLFDFVLGQRVYKELTLSLGIENVLNWPRRFTQGPDRDITYLVWPGASFKLGAEYRF